MILVPKMEKLQWLAGIDETNKYARNILHGEAWQIRTVKLTLSECKVVFSILRTEHKRD